MSGWRAFFRIAGGTALVGPLGAVLALLFCSALITSACAQDGWAALSAPGTHAIMRHALAPGTGDPADFQLGNCGTQRNLDATGREQARAIGRAIDKAGVAVTRVLTSQWCRAAETARLLDAGPVVEEPALNSFFGERTAQAGQTARLRQLLSGLGGSDRLVLVTHQVNITALTGDIPASGEILVVTVGTGGTVRVVARIATEPQ